MSYENKRDKLKKKLRANRPKINGKKYFSDKAIKREHQAEIKKYKELLDSGIISQEEFDAKKKQILGV